MHRRNPRFRSVYVWLEVVVVLVVVVMFEVVVVVVVLVHGLAHGGSVVQEPCL